MVTFAEEPKISVKVVDANGPISLGKDYAGRQVLVDEREPGIWLVRAAVVIPENERWLHAPQAAADLQAALVWTAKNKPQETSKARFRVPGFSRQFVLNVLTFFGQLQMD